MQQTRPMPLSGAQDVAQLAKAALRRLALDKLEPTPENYARAYRLESGEPADGGNLPERGARIVERLAARAFESEAVAAELGQSIAQGRWEVAERLLQSQPGADAAALASLIERIVRGLERGSRQWTGGRKKDSLLRVLSGSRSDARKLQQRLSQLVASWDSDSPLEGDDVRASAPMPLEANGPVATLPGALDAAAHAPLPDTTPHWTRIAGAYSATIAAALPEHDHAAQALATELDALSARLRDQPPDAPLAETVDDFAQRARQLIAHRHRLLQQLGGLCEQLTDSLAELAENDSWVQGQCAAMRTTIGDGLTGRGVRAVEELLRDTRARQGELRAERERARDSLKGLINQMLSELDELGSQTGNFHDSVGRYADVIEKADSLESLAGAVREMVEESRTVHSLVQQTQGRLKDETQKARGLSERVTELEGEMRRLSEEVSTDQLTQVANRRGLVQAFETERARLERAGGELSVGLLDIDNFKRLNDELGHGAGDQALKSLAALVSATLRPTDRVARYGGEEFVVLLPDTPVGEGQQILTRLQRALTGGLFMHESKQVFVTFSAGVTAYRGAEPLEEALERADQALYEAKRTGKNRTCVA